MTESASDTKAAIRALERYSETMGRTDMTLGDALSYLRAQLDSDPAQQQAPDEPEPEQPTNPE